MEEILNKIKNLEAEAGAQYSAYMEELAEMRRSVLAQHAPAPPPQPPQPEMQDSDFVRRLRERNRKRARRMEKALTGPKSSGWLTKGSAAAAKRAPKWQPKPDPLRPPTPPGYWDVSWRSPEKSQ